MFSQTYFLLCAGLHVSEGAPVCCGPGEGPRRRPTLSPLPIYAWWDGGVSHLCFTLQSHKPGQREIWRQDAKCFIISIFNAIWRSFYVQQSKYRKPLKICHLTSNMGTIFKILMIISLIGPTWYFFFSTDKLVLFLVGWHCHKLARWVWKTNVKSRHTLIKPMLLIENAWKPNGFTIFVRP